MFTYFDDVKSEDGFH